MRKFSETENKWNVIGEYDHSVDRCLEIEYLLLHFPIEIENRNTKYRLCHFSFDFFFLFLISEKNKNWSWSCFFICISFNTDKSIFRFFFLSINSRCSLLYSSWMWNENFNAHNQNVSRHWILLCLNLKLLHLPNVYIV